MAKMDVEAAGSAPKRSSRPYRWPRLRPAAAAVWLLALMRIGSVATGQIYEWRDEQGTRHFTNSLDALPHPARQKAQLFVEPGPMTPADAGLPISRADGPVGRGAEGTQAREEETKAAPVAGDAYERGWREGFAAGVGERLDRLERGREEGEEAAAPAPPPAPPVIVIEVPRQERFYDPSGLYYRPPSSGVKVPFDRGRTRGRTRRQQIQDRIQAERERR